jgi:hypothetical protein
MKKKIALLILAGVVAAGLTILCVRHYRSYRQLKVESDKVATAQAEKQISSDRAAEQVRQAALVTAFNKLHAECVKGVGYYNAYINSLPVANRGKGAAPVCGAETVQ